MNRWIAGILLMAAPCLAQWDAPLVSRVVALGSDGRTVAPGSMIVITGDSLSLTSESSEGTPAESLAGVKVEVAQGTSVRAVMLASVTPKRIVGLLPRGLTGSSGEVRVTHALGIGKASLRLAPAAPAVSSYTEASGGRAIVWHADGSPANETDAPLVPGETVTLRAYGLGELHASPSREVVAKVEARIGAVAVEVTGAEASEPGVYLVRFVVPADLPAGWKSLTLQAAGRDSEASQQIYIGPRYVTLVDAYARGACEGVSSGQFTLETSAIVRQFWLRTRWLGGPATYTIERDGERVMAGTLFAREFEPGQSEWRGATSANIITASVAEFPTGLYTITLANAELCALPETRARAAIRLSGSWTGSPWQPAESGVSVERAVEPPAVLKMSGGSSEGRLSSYYRIQGLPANPGEPLVLKIDLEGTPPPEGAQLFLKTEGNGAQAPMVLKGEVQDGRLVVTIPAAVQKDAARSAAGNVSGMILWVGMGMNNTDSSDGHFRVYYPAGEYELAKKIAAFMERAYTLIGNMGLDWRKRNTWPLDVYLFSYSSWSSYLLGGSGTAEGNTESDLWGNEGVGLCLNLDTIKQNGTYFLDDAAVTSGHELLHIMQTLYDTRGRLRKTLTHSSWLWLMEASATWLERSVAANAAYRPLNAVDNWDFLFKNGLEVPAGYFGAAAVRAHGYGASAFLQYLAPASPGAAPDSIGRIIAKLGVEDSAGIVLSSPAYAPVPTLRGEFGADLGDKWIDFCDQYIQGAIWSGFPEMGVVLNGRSKPEPLTLSSKVLTGKQAWSAPDLSAKHFLIAFDPADKPAAAADEELTLRLSDPAYASKAFLYEVGDSGWIPWGSFRDELTIADARGLIEAGTNFYVLIANGHCSAGCAGSTPVEFSVRLSAPFAGELSYTDERRLNHYNATYSSTLDVRVSGSAPFRLKRRSATLPSSLGLELETPPFDPSQPDAVDSYTINITHKDIDFKNYKTVEPGYSYVFVMGVPPGSLTERTSASVTIDVPRGSRGRTVQSNCSVRLKDSKGVLTEVTGGSDAPLLVDFIPWK